ncbi:adaptor protein MecA [Lachnobacterium bovis]|uniref:Adapter protein MecA 1/2 n=1 Tax=Lachnobacterium bovis TaxID=140626 RepID=A0A1H9TVX3_9FIRM|nr:adaptor protein MecA [Lachnobacterium bovis]SES01134.1 adapter protein MecA 1/2 [Lachnobacterium bovis]
MGNHTIQCVVTEEEIIGLGYTMDDIMSNGEKTQEFMHHIFNMAEKEFHIDLELGVKKVRANFRPNHTIALTFSETHLDPCELDQDYERERIEEIQPDDRVEGLLVFNSFNNLEEFSNKVKIEKSVPNRLYRLNGSYILLIEIGRLTDEQVKSLSFITDEYADGAYTGVEKKAFIEEHGKMLIEANALEVLKKL